MNFASDNIMGASAPVMQALMRANAGAMPGLTSWRAVRQSRCAVPSGPADREAWLERSLCARFGRTGIGLGGTSRAGASERRHRRRAGE